MASNGARPASGARRAGPQTSSQAGLHKLRGVQEPGAAQEAGHAEEGLGPDFTASNGSEPAALSPASGLLELAERALARGAPEEALEPAQKALRLLDTATAQCTVEALPALSILATVNLELGEADTARDLFLQAVALDPEGEASTSLSGDATSRAENYLWLAQLSEEGGEESVRYYKQGISILDREIHQLETELKTQSGNPETKPHKQAMQIARDSRLKAKQKQLASAHCSIVEIYMTDLSLELDAERMCETHIDLALAAAAWAPEPLQTLASVRISQGQIEQARGALQRSMALWTNPEEEEEEDEDHAANDALRQDGQDATPDFPTRISLTRLLMEVEMEEQALAVLETMVQEDDRSVEAWYLGGWCLYLLGRRGQMGTRGDRMGGEAEKGGAGEEEDGRVRAALISSLEWFRRALRLYEILEYEDERLRDHAVELVEELEGMVGAGSIEEDEEDDARTEDIEDEDMGGM